MRRFSKLLAALATCSIATAGCAGSDPASSGVVVRDSAGIRIIESSAPLIPAGSEWSVSTTYNVEIGGNESDSTQILDQVESAVRLGDGRIVIANAADPSLRWYDGSGKFALGAGRYGQGPGEFDGGEGSVWIYAVWALPGDSVATWEHSRRRMQVFSPQGKFVRAVVIDLPPDMPQLAYPQISGRMSDGLLAFLLDERREDRPVGVVRRDSAAFIRYTADGKFAKEIARLPAFVSYMGEIKRPGTNQVFRVALRPPFAAPFVAWPHGNRFYYGDAESFQIAAYDTSGAVRLLIRRPGPRRPVTRDIIDQYRQTRLASAGDDPQRRRDTEEQLRSIPYPDSLPAYRRIRVDSEGMLWVQDYDLPGATMVSWLVFDQEGRWITSVAVPYTWRIVDIGRDHVLTIESDSLDVERVRMYALRRSAASR